MTMRLSRLTLCAAFIVGACGGEPGRTTADSDLPIWALSAEPSFRLTDSGPNTEFTGIRGVDRLDDGSVLVTNFSRPAELRLFDASGVHQWTRGGDGEGPGEFRGIGWTRFLGDTLIVFDPWQSRFSKISLDGEVLDIVNVTEWRNEGGLSGLYAVALLGDGTLIAQQNRFFPDGTSGSGRGAMPLMRASLEGAILDTIGTFETADYVPGAEGRLTLPLFARRAALATNGDQLLHGMGDDFSFRAYSLEGEVLRTYERSAASRPVNQQMVDAMKEAELARVQGPESDMWRAQIETKYRDLVRLETLPAYQRFVVSTDGTIWVQAYYAPTDSVMEWSVFRESGEFIGILEVPASFQIMSAGADYVAGVWTDEFDVETPRVYGLGRTDDPT